MECTFFTRKEILRVYGRFKELATEHFRTSGEDANALRLPHSIIERMPEFKENPFRKKICKIFTENGEDEMSFEDFLNMFSVFSESTPKQLKTVYAFKIYDYDGDNALSKGDLICTVNSLTRNELTNDEVDFVCEKVCEEADLDDDDIINFTEFEHVISRAPDFLSTFHIRV